jgi:hypothetical protein
VATTEFGGFTHKRHTKNSLPYNNNNNNKTQFETLHNTTNERIHPHIMTTISTTAVVPVADNGTTTTTMPTTTTTIPIPIPTTTTTTTTPKPKPPALVFGASGEQGRAVLEGFVDAGYYPVYAFSRSHHQDQDQEGITTNTTTTTTTSTTRNSQPYSSQRLGFNDQYLSEALGCILLTGDIANPQDVRNALTSSKAQAIFLVTTTDLPDEQQETTTNKDKIGGGGGGTTSIITTGGYKGCNGCRTRCHFPILSNHPRGSPSRSLTKNSGILDTR